MQVEVDGENRGSEPLTLFPLLEAVEDLGLENELKSSLHHKKEHHALGWEESLWTFYIEDLKDLCREILYKIKENSSKGSMRKVRYIEGIFMYCHKEFRNDNSRITFYYEDGNTKHSRLNRKTLYRGSPEKPMIKYSLTIGASDRPELIKENVENIVSD